MTTKETKLFAEFMASRYRGKGEGTWIDDNGEVFVIIKTEWAEEADTPLFNPYEWKWLMPIVEKINGIESTKHTHYHLRIKEAAGAGDVNKTVKAVKDYIEMFNKLQLTNCRAIYKIGKDEKCYSEKCLMNVHPEFNLYIKKEGCVRYKEITK